MIDLRLRAKAAKRPQHPDQRLSLLQRLDLIERPADPNRLG
jgi:hypothetical protein